MRLTVTFAVFLLLAACNCGDRVGRVVLTVDAEPRAIDFGVVAPGGKVSRKVTLTARGGAIRVDRVTVHDDARASFSMGSGWPSTLQQDVPVDLELDYAPRSVGADSATATVVLDTEGLPNVDVALVGHCLVSVEGPDGGADAGSDAGFDAGLPDSGLPDAGVPDAGFDAGVPDSGSSVDAGRDDAGVLHFDGGECPGTEQYGYARWPAFGAVNLPTMFWEGSDWVTFFYKTESWFGRVDAYGQAQAATLQQVTPGLSSLSIFVRAARTPTEWGIVYTDDRAGSGTRAIYFARVTTSGVVVPGSEVQLTGGASDWSATIAFNPLDSEYGVLSGSGSSVQFARVSAAGTVVGGSTRTLTNANTNAYRTGEARSLVWAGDRWVAVWPEASTVKLEEIDRMGNLIASSLTTIATSAPADPAVAASPTQYAVAWRAMPTLSDAHVRLARVGIGGSAIPNSELRLGTDAGLSDSPDLVWDGQQFFIGFAQQVGQPGTNQRIAIAAVALDGGVTLPSKVVTCNGTGDDFYPSVSWNGSVHSLVWARQYAPMGTITQEGRVLLIP